MTNVVKNILLPFIEIDNIDKQSNAMSLLKSIKKFEFYFYSKRFRTECYKEPTELSAKDTIFEIYTKTINILIETISSRFEIENIGRIETIYSLFTETERQNNNFKDLLSIYTRN
ncbi:hypothetical protein BpHYR1_035606 [Brachionus plicatilis]|uniref:Uncharacterized protein n=1 Tax=Brachionus plicatilis TaxID=10195 RepID=A0A3M7R258_BRAPC|nr:hypothetical protein BpHYR1_035606 [Brachionus plicatilis]